MFDSSSSQWKVHLIWRNAYLTYTALIGVRCVSERRKEWIVGVVLEFRKTCFFLKHCCWILHPVTQKMLMNQLEQLLIIKLNARLRYHICLQKGKILYKLRAMWFNTSAEPWSFAGFCKVRELWMIISRLICCFLDSALDFFLEVCVKILSLLLR